MNHIVRPLYISGDGFAQGRQDNREEVEQEALRLAMDKIEARLLSQTRTILMDEDSSLEDFVPTHWNASYKDETSTSSEYDLAVRVSVNVEYTHDPYSDVCSSCLEEDDLDNEEEADDEDEISDPVGEEELEPRYDGAVTSHYPGRRGD